MTLVDDLNNKFAKTYTVMAKCSNCSAVQDVKVPKGETIESYFASERGVCNICRCASLEKYQKPEPVKIKNPIPTNIPFTSSPKPMYIDDYGKRNTQRYRSTK